MALDITDSKYARVQIVEKRESITDMPQYEMTWNEDKPALISGDMIREILEAFLPGNRFILYGVLVEVVDWDYMRDLGVIIKVVDAHPD